jgi:electron transfer flavoprotein beta subunit
VTAVTKLELGEGSATAHREIEGAVEIVGVSLPALITVERGINEARYPSLPGIMKAKRMPITVKTAADLEVDAAAAGGSRVELLGLTPPPKRQAGRLLQGEPAEVVRELVKALHEEAKVL